jgi:Uncharacterised protein family (UPF0172)
MSDAKSKSNVDVAPEAFVAMVLHAAQNPTTVVHGLLMGTFKGNTVHVIKAIPVCHETPTTPLLETALGLAGAVLEESCVGWYTAPERLGDTQPGPVALRIASNMATIDNAEPVLIVLDNEGLVACLKGESTPNVMKALGKDFGQQWMEPLALKVISEPKARAAAKSAFAEGIQVVDLANHMDDESFPDWISNAALTKHVAKVSN